MEISDFFINAPLCFLFLSLVVVAFVVAIFLPRGAWVSNMLGCVLLIGMVIFSFLSGATYLDVALLCLIGLFPLLIELLIPKKKKEPEQP